MEYLKSAVDCVRKGGVIIVPTDTVYGFIADASNKKAIDKIFRLKKRQKDKPLPVFVKGIKMAKELAFINERQEEILKRYWPGKYTFVFKRKKGIKLYGVGKETIALRIPKHKLLNALLKKIDRPLVQTSVNLSGKPALNKIKDIIKEFEKADLIINAGNLPKRKPSRIVDLTEGRRVIRN